MKQIRKKLKKLTPQEAERVWKWSEARLDRQLKSILGGISLDDVITQFLKRK